MHNMRPQGAMSHKSRPPRRRTPYPGRPATDPHPSPPTKQPVITHFFRRFPANPADLITLPTRLHPPPPSPAPKVHDSSVDTSTVSHQANRYVSTTNPPTGRASPPASPPTKSDTMTPRPSGPASHQTPPLTLHTPLPTAPHHPHTGHPPNLQHTPNLDMIALPNPSAKTLDLQPLAPTLHDYHGYQTPSVPPTSQETPTTTHSFPATRSQPGQIGQSLNRSDRIFNSLHGFPSPLTDSAPPPRSPTHPTPPTISSHTPHLDIIAPSKTVAKTTDLQPPAPTLHDYHGLPTPSVPPNFPDTLRPTRPFPAPRSPQGQIGQINHQPDIVTSTLHGLNSPHKNLVPPCPRQHTHSHSPQHPPATPMQASTTSPSHPPNRCSLPTPIHDGPTPLPGLARTTSPYALPSGSDPSVA